MNLKKNVLSHATIFILLIYSPMSLARTIVFKPRWILNDQSAGELYAQEKSKKDPLGVQIQVLPYDESEDQYHAVLLNHADISEGEAITLLQNIEKDNSDIVVLAMKEQISAAGYLSLKNKNIASPKDLEGKIIGIYSDDSIDHLRWFCKLYQVDFHKITFKKITSDNLKYLIDNIVDIIIAHDANEPLVLKRMGYDTHFIPLYGPKSVYYGSVYFCRRDFYEKNKDALKQFVKSVSEGWRWAIQNPSDAAEMVMKYYPESHYLMGSKELTKEKTQQGITIRAFHLTYNVGLNCIGCIVKTQWDVEVNELCKNGLLKNDGKLSNVVQYDLTEDLFKNTSF